MAYRIILKPAAQKDLDDIPDRDVVQTSKRIFQLENDSRPFGVQKLSGTNGYRIRSGTYHILYQIDDGNQTISIFRIKHRKDAYR